MTSNLGVAVSQTKQNDVPNLLPEQNRFEERCLTAAFVEMSGELKCRPEPRAVFDNVAGGRAAYKGRDALLAAKSVIRAAIATGNRTTIENTARRVCSFFDHLKHCAVADYLAIAAGSISLDEAKRRASKETSEALHAIAVSAINHDDHSPLTIQEIDEAIQALSNLRAQMTVAASTTPRRAALRLS